MPRTARAGGRAARRVSASGGDGLPEMSCWNNLKKIRASESEYRTHDIPNVFDS
jgi:hypothetical protein